MNKVLRAFVAIELSQEARSYVIQLMELLQQEHLAGIRWVKPKGIHITLKFLGNVARERIAEIVGVMASVAISAPPINMELGDLGVFPNLQTPRVIWIGTMNATDSLLALQTSFDDKLSKLGFPKEKRPFSPHITIGRITSPLSLDIRERLATLVVKPQGIPPTKASVTTLSLMESILSPAGAKYERLATAYVGI